MKINKIASIIVLSLFMVACSSDFDKAMKSGREALKSGKYEEAIKQFDLALIEKPNDKDAIALYDKSEDSVKEEKIQKRKDRFKTTFNPIYEKLQSFHEEVDVSKDPLKINDPTAQKNLEKAKRIREELDSFANEWMYNGGIEEESYWALSEATDGLISAYKYVLDPPNEDPSNFPDTRAGRLAAYDNDPRNAINTEFIRYITYLESYKQKMSPAD